MTAARVADASDPAATTGPVAARARAVAAHSRHRHVPRSAIAETATLTGRVPEQPAKALPAATTPRANGTADTVTAAATRPVSVVVRLRQRIDTLADALEEADMERARLSRVNAALRRENDLLRAVRQPAGRCCVYCGVPLPTTTSRACVDHRPLLAIDPAYGGTPA